METYGGAREATNNNTVWFMRVACWINKATRARAHAHVYVPEHACTRAHREKSVVPIAYPRQQWVRERALILRYTFIICLVVC